MQTEKIHFFSDGHRLGGLLRWPDERSPGQAIPVIINPPGFLGLAAGPTAAMYHENFTRAGFAVATLDYQGFGDSEGDHGWIHPGRQLDDLQSLMAYLSTRYEDLDQDNVFCYGQGGTGGGNALIFAAVDRRIRAVAAQTVVADGAAWLRSMRSESEWQRFLKRLEHNNQELALGREGELVDPREEIMVATPERRQESSRSYSDSRNGSTFHLASASKLLAYRPVDYVARIAPRPTLLIALESDVVTPSEIGALPLYEAAGAPKKLIVQSGKVSHYEAYRTNLDQMSREIIAWFTAARSDGVVSRVEQLLGDGLELSLAAAGLSATKTEE